MNTTAHFKRTIQAYLEQRAAEDRLFAEAYRKDGKNIDDCITYILNSVRQAGATALRMARYTQWQSTTMTRTT